MIAFKLFLPSLLPHHDSPKVTFPGTPTGLPKGFAPVDPEHPFRGTPANLWPQGADGVQLPAAEAVGRYSADQVAAAEARAKQLITVARLDQHVLETGDPEPVLALLSQGTVDTIRPQLTPGNASRTPWLTTKLAAGNKLLPTPPRVDGSMSAELDDKGALSIKTNYIVAYAFQAPDQTAITDPMDIIVLVREQVEYIWIDDPRYDQPSQGMHFGKIQGHTYNADCDWFNKGYLAATYGRTTSHGGATQPRSPSQYFDPTIPLPTESNC
ncbi:hypothetical protein GFY24_19110 [Nocardia sp. SYP-A9097]|uniref:hypothetical protein n=1 Tax=Nocardia sp. SYP-A9097 TaxID=2663237 RepID=UPI00129BD882|nr:hypothetical protein [Nocardia sp. SYP-A9097]MRH89528.1 hypothetical protein [Nocardia sp. SYP-A9097]